MIVTQTTTATDKQCLRFPSTLAEKKRKTYLLLNFPPGRKYTFIENKKSQAKSKHMCRTINVKPKIASK